MVSDHHAGFGKPERFAPLVPDPGKKQRSVTDNACPHSFEPENKIETFGTKSPVEEREKHDERHSETNEEPNLPQGSEYDTQYFQNGALNYTNAARRNAESRAERRFSGFFSKLSFCRAYFSLVMINSVRRFFACSSSGQVDCICPSQIQLFSSLLSPYPRLVILFLLIPFLMI